MHHVGTPYVKSPYVKLIYVISTYVVLYITTLYVKKRFVYVICCVVYEDQILRSDHEKKGVYSNDVYVIYRHST